MSLLSVKLLMGKYELQFLSVTIVEGEGIKIVLGDNFNKGGLY